MDENCRFVDNLDVSIYLEINNWIHYIKWIIL